MPQILNKLFLRFEKILNNYPQPLYQQLHAGSGWLVRNFIIIFPLVFVFFFILSQSFS